MTLNRRCGGPETPVARLGFTARMKALFVRLFASLCVTPVCDALYPSTAEERIEAARRETAERTRLRGLVEIHRVTADNIVFFSHDKK